MVAPDAGRARRRAGAGHPTDHSIGPGTIEALVVPGDEGGGAGSTRGGHQIPSSKTIRGPAPPGRSRRGHADTQP